MNKNVKRIICLLLLITIFTGVLSACDSPKALFAKAKDANPTKYVTQLAEITELADCNVTQSGNGLVTATKKTDATQQGVYSYVENKLIVPFGNYAALTVNADGLITAAQRSGEGEAATVSTKVFDSVGTLVFEDSADTAFTLTQRGLFYAVGSKAVYVKDGISVLAYDTNAASFDDGIFKAERVTEKYFYDMDTATLAIFNRKEGKRITTLDLAKYIYGNTDDLDLFLLSGDKILLQTQTLLPADSKKYDFYDGKDKKNVQHLLITAKNGKVKKANFDFVVTGVDNSNTDDLFYTQYRKSIDNIVYGNKYDDKLLSANVSILTTNNKLRIDENLTEELYGYNGHANIGSNFIIYTSNGTSLVKGGGKLISHLAGIDMMNSKYLVYNGVIYNASLKKKGEYDDTKFDLVGMSNKQLFLTDEAGKYFVKEIEGEEAPAAITSTYTDYNGFYAFVADGNNVTLYTDDGERIGGADYNGLAVLRTFVRADQQFALCGSGDGKFYRLY